MSYNPLCLAGIPGGCGACFLCDSERFQELPEHARPAVAVHPLDDDILQPDYPIELVDADLREMGLEPGAAAQRGLEFVGGLLNERRRT